MVDTKRYEDLHSNNIDAGSWARDTGTATGFRAKVPSGPPLAPKGIDSAIAATHAHNTASTRSPFLDLPGEIRNSIYELGLETGIKDGAAVPPIEGHEVEIALITLTVPPIARTCKQVHAETKLLIADMYRTYVANTRFAIHLNLWASEFEDVYIEELWTINSQYYGDAIDKLFRLCGSTAVAIKHLYIDVDEMGWKMWSLEQNVWREDSPDDDERGYLPISYKRALEQAGCKLGPQWPGNEDFVKFRAQSAAAKAKVQAIVEDRKITREEILDMVGLVMDSEYVSEHHLDQERNKWGDLWDDKDDADDSGAAHDANDADDGSADESADD